MSGARHVVVGAGPLGRAVAAELSVRGLPVVVVTRRGTELGLPGVEAARGDAADPDDAVRFCTGAAAVYGAAQPPYTAWAEHFPTLQEGLLAGARAAGAVFVAGENLYMYGPVAGPLTPDLSYRATGRKGAVRAAMAQRLHDLHAAGSVRTASARASDFFGPFVTSSAVGDRYVPKVLAGKPVVVMGDPDAPHSCTYIGDAARTMVAAALDERAWGRAWHVPNAPTLTQRELAAKAYAAAGTSGRVRRAPAALVAALGVVVPMLRELREVSYQFARPFVVDHTETTRTLGVEPTPWEQSLDATLGWYRDAALDRAAARQP
jgi:nucleoside-diphosphate-sugar epimerase